MFISGVIIALIAFGGMAITYLFAEEENFLWRMSSGVVIGSAVFGTAGFAIALFFGLSAVSVLISLGITLLPLLLLREAGRRAKFRLDWQRAKGKLQGASARKFVRFSFYAFFFLLFLAFFERAMLEKPQGIFTGGSQNLGDLPFHLGAIFSFTEGNNFPPENPSFAGARFSYPFIADFITASFVKLGIGVKDAMLAQNVAWAFSLLVLLERFVFKLTSDRLAGKLAPAILFFSGGLGFFAFFSDYWAQASGFFTFLWHLPTDYTIGEHFRWGNSLVVMFITQRSLLLGMPLTLIVLGILWKIFTSKARLNEESVSAFSIFHFPFSIFVVGLITGLLPLIHLHSLAVLFVVTVVLFVLRPARWLEWTAFGVGVFLIAIPELIWSLMGSATSANEFFSWHFGWDKGDKNFLWFWLTNTGIFIPLAIAGIWIVFLALKNKKSERMRLGDAEKPVQVKRLIPASQRPVFAASNHGYRSLLLFSTPFAFLFLISNAAKLAPWEWDNIKVLIYWFIGSIPLVVFALTWFWRRTLPLKMAAGGCFLVLIFSGAIDVWRTVSGQINYKVFDSDAMLVAERIKTTTQPNALFLNAPTYNTAVVLSGRRSLMRYPGHLGSHGINYAQRETDVKRIYAGGPDAAALLQKYGIQYVLISPEEKNSLAVNEDFFKRFPAIAEAGQYKVYKITN